MRCGYCGRENEADALYCEYCGERILAEDGVPYLNAGPRSREPSYKEALSKKATSKELFSKASMPEKAVSKEAALNQEKSGRKSSRVEYLGHMEFDITHTIEDYEYTRRSVLDMNRIMDSREFREMDSETIYHYLLGQMKIVSFKDYLKRYIYERHPQQTPFARVKEDVYTKIIIDSFQKNHAPGSFNEIEVRWKATVRYWLRKESATRDNVFLLGFGLKMTDSEVSDFLIKVLKEQDFRFQDPRETVFWYCYHYGLEYSAAKKYLDYYDQLTEADIKPVSIDFTASGSEDDIFGGLPSGEMTVSDFYNSAEASVRQSLPLELFVGRDIQRVLTDEQKLKEYLAVLKSHQDKMPDVIAEEYRALYKRAARAAYKIVRIEDEGGDRRKQRKEATPAEIEMILCSGIPKNSSGNLVNVSRSILNKQFQKKRMSRQRISRAMKYSNVIERFDFITLLFLVYAIEVEPDWPVERFMAYIDEINEILARCNMMSIYPVNPYESFILMCLLTEEPLGTYADIWELSFESI